GGSHMTNSVFEDLRNLRAQADEALLQLLTDDARRKRTSSSVRIEWASGWPSLGLLSHLWPPFLRMAEGTSDPTSRAARLPKLQWVGGVYQRHEFAKERRMALEAWAAHVAGSCRGTASGQDLLLCHCHHSSDTLMKMADRAFE